MFVWYNRLAFCGGDGRFALVNYELTGSGSIPDISTINNAKGSLQGAFLDVLHLVNYEFVTILAFIVKYFNKKFNVFVFKFFREGKYNSLVWNYPEFTWVKK